MKEFIIRSISGLLYAILIIAAALYSDLSFIIVIFVFCSLALYEFQKLIQYKSPVPFILFGLIIYQFYNNKLNPYLHLSLLGLSILSNLFLAYLLFSKKFTNSSQIFSFMYQPPTKESNLYFSSFII